MQTGIFKEVLAAEQARMAAEQARLDEELRTGMSIAYPNELLMEMFTGSQTDSGVRVTPLTALQVVTVYSCVDLISGALAAQPLNVYERVLVGEQKRVGKRLAFEQELFDLLHDEPNPEMSSFDWRKTMQCHALLWSNAYGEIRRDYADRPGAVWPLNPSQTRPVRDLTTGELFYVSSEGLDHNTTPERRIAARDMIHIRGLSLDGRLGQDVIQLARQAVGLALASEGFAAKFFGNGAVLSLVLEHPGSLKKLAAANLRDSLLESQGGRNMHKPMVLEEGMKVNKVGTAPEEAQMLETRMHQQREICSLFHVPPHMLGDSSSQNRANTEQMGLEFVTYCMRPWFSSWEHELRRKLFAGPARGRNASKKFFPLFDVRNLMLPDSASRQAFYASGKQWGFLSTNDIHELEDMNPIDDPTADCYWQPVNMRSTQNAEAADAKAAAELLAAPPAIPPMPPAQNMLVPAYFRLFRDAFGRALNRDRADIKGFRRVFEPVFLAFTDLLMASVDPSLRDGNSFPTSLLEFARDYVGAMHVRSTTWTAEKADEQTWAELLRAGAAIQAAVAREVARRAAADSSTSKEPNHET